MKFQGGRPSLEVSHKEIQSWGLEHPFSIGPLSSRAFLLRFQDSKDLTRVLTRPSTLLITFPYKIFRWHSLCHIKEDSCFAPVWISLPRLPLQCFIPEFLESVANKIGRFLCFDIATSTLARPSSARMCIELDLRKPPPPFIWVGLFEGLKQPIIYERMPKFCNICQAQGHLASVCPKGQRETPPVQTEPRSEAVQERTQRVRQNATRKSPPITDHHNASSAAFHTPTTPSPPPLPPNPNPAAETSRSSAPCSADEVAGQSHHAPLLPSPIAAGAPPPVQPNSPSPSIAPSALSANSSQPLLKSSDHQATPPPPPPPTNQPTTSIPPRAIPPPVIPTALFNPPPSISSHQQTSQQHSPSASLPQLSNLDANQLFWYAVNNQLALNKQARLKAPNVDASNSPIAIDSTRNIIPSPLTTVPQSSPSSDDSSSKSSVAADSQPNSPSTTSQGAHIHYESLKKTSYDSEGEAPMTEPTSFIGHNTDEVLWQRPRKSKRNKRHPDQPLKVQLRARKVQHSHPLC